MINVTIVSNSPSAHALRLARYSDLNVTEVIPSTLAGTIDDVEQSQPDMIVLEHGAQNVDVDMLCHVLNKRHPYARSLILVEQKPTFEMLQNSGFKARGYLTPEQWPMLEKAIRVVHDGEAWLPRKLVTDMLNRFASSFIMVDEPEI